MSDDNLRQESATSDDPSRPVATRPDSDFTLSIDEASVLYERAGHPRTPRSIQRYCAKGHLEYRRIETSFGEKYLITPESVMKHIAYIEEVSPVATSRDLSRHAATSDDTEPAAPTSQQEKKPSIDEPRQPATDDRYVAVLERENEFLRGQITVKDTQISSLQERAHETNSLINGLQRLLAPLLSAPERDRGRDQTDDDR